MDKVFAIGDIHGSYELLESLLQFWNHEEEQLVFLGDYIDRGPDSLKVLQKIIQLTKTFGAITLCGNHEQLFLNWLEKPEEISEFYFNPKVGGAATIQSFYSEPSFNQLIDRYSIKEMTETIQRNNEEIIQFLKNLRRFYHWDPYLFVHAGIDATVKNFRDTKKDDFFWIREEFYSTPHLAKEIVVFGHTPTVLINKDKSSKVWISPCRKKIGIDGGGAIYERGRLHGVVFTKGSKEITIHSVRINEKPIVETIEIV